MIETLEGVAPHPRLPQTDRSFIEEKLPGIIGWLTNDAAYFTSYLMNSQAERQIEGPAVEIGVYHGKYLSLLMHQCLKHDQIVVGYDIFEQSHSDTPRNHAKELFGSSEKMLIAKGSSSALSGRQIRNQAGGRPRIMSVDGDHSAKGALNDLYLAQAVIHPRGVVVVDDVYNTFAIGVSEAFFRYLLSWRGKLVPFAQIGNKTMLCHASEHAAYLATSLQFVADCPELPINQRFAENRLKGEGWVIQRLANHQVALFN